MAVGPALLPTPSTRLNQGDAGVTHGVWETNERAGPLVAGAVAAAAGMAPTRTGTDRVSVQKAILANRVDTGTR